MTATGFAEVAAGVYALRYPVYDVTVTLVVGDDAALVVDTLSTAEQATELAEAVRRVTAHPWTVVNTHHHFDHAFGNATFAAAGAPVWGHEGTANRLNAGGERTKRELSEELADAQPELAAQIAAVRVHPPERTVHQEATLDIGGRRVTLRFLGRGHTDNDLVVAVPDADVLVAGDLVESGGPPGFGDAYPLEWADTVAGLLRMTGPGTVVLPGHGPPVDSAFVLAQHADLTRLEWLIREGHANHSPVEAVAARSPFGVETSLPAVRRGYALLDGTLS
ncbi:MBL fold metallo-hydrolase [Rhizomonospora bruguierae]|uniref:MBL fold metallo-hydrolase n=1 Tax=Rhizomonospora bruguierae TaxID=1581705 RepID=UPI001BCFE4D1|nr:MBL fold metallo-hydrolase [Micromonospora sp. NBRC 107566]